jgi:hypothetical protein
MIPNDEAINAATAPKLAADLRSGIDHIIQRAAQRGIQLPANLDPISMLSASCGLGSTSVEIAGQVLDTLSATALELRS